MDFRPVDADNHFYEPDDCFTRHLESKYADRAMHVRRGEDGAGRWYFGDRPIVFLREALDRTLLPGALQALFKSGDPARVPLEFIETERPEFRGPAARAELLDRQGLEAAILYYGIGVVAEHEMRADPEAAHANVRAYNRWIEDDWGWAYEDRLFVPALLSMLDPAAAVAELERVLAAGARLLVLRPGPIYGVSPADRRYDPFWARIDEARVPVVYHVSQAGYTHWYAKEWGEDPDVDDQTMGPFVIFTGFGARPVQDTILNISLRNLFGRFSNLRVLSVENGADWVKPLLKVDRQIKNTIRTRAGQMDRSGDFIATTLEETLRRHLWVAPYPEEDPREAIDVLGIDHVLFGSDYPHPEGLGEPLEYARKFKLSDVERRKIMRENTAQLLGIES